MSKSRSDRVNLSATLRETSSEESSDRPFRILVLGNFGGSQRPTGEFKSRVVDRDNLEEVLNRLDVTLKLQIQELGSIEVPINELDDFHPDRLYERLEVFDRLRDLRDRLDNPKTFVDAARELGAAALEPVRPAEAAPVEGSLLDQVLAATEGGPAGVPIESPGYELHRFLARAVHEHLVPGADPRRDELVEKVDAATADLMRAVLHHPEFQTIEAAWRSLFLLTRRLDTDENLKIFIGDLTSDELASQLAGEDLAKSALGELLMPCQPGQGDALGPWSLVVGLYEFGHDVDSLIELSALANLAQAADAPLLAGGSARLLGTESLFQTPDADEWQPLDNRLAAAWNSLRSRPAAAYIGLALPRFLIRLPYGPNASETETFAFEEIVNLDDHQSYLWANPAVAIGCVLAMAYCEQGWNFNAGTWLELGGLPLHVVSSDDEPQAKPCAEVLLSDETIDALLERGIITLASHRDRDAIGVPRLQSIADPPQPLAGRW